MVKERGAQVVMTDLTHEATRRAQAKGLNASQLYIAEEDIPWPDASFDVVVSDSAIEHLFDPARPFDELARVLKPGGTFILCLPNIGHWRYRWLLMCGKFPYISASPTDFTHLRFFTLTEIRQWLGDRNIVIDQVDGSPSTWVRGLYPAWIRHPWVRPWYEKTAHHWPTLLARDLIVIGRKQGA
jgi:SAM-dependent methyltransferase